MARTAAQIRNDAAKDLGVLATGQTLRSEISADLDQAYNEVYAQIEQENLATWALADSVPDEYVNPVVSMVAASRLNRYSVPNDKYQRIANEASVAMKAIRRFNHQPKTETTKIEEY